ALLAAAEAGTPADPSSLRACISAGEALPAPLAERWHRRFGLPILDGIGSTEIGYIAISNSAGEVTPGSSGRVVPGYEARVVGAECAVVGPADADGLLKVCAYVVLRGATPPAELDDLCAERLARHKRPRWIEPVAELPKTATGKIQRFRLRETASA